MLQRQKVPVQHEHAGMKKTAFTMMPMMNQRKKNTETDPLFINPPNDTYTPYFKEFEGKRAQTLLLWSSSFSISY